MIREIMLQRHERSSSETAAHTSAC